VAKLFAFKKNLLLFVETIPPPPAVKLLLPFKEKILISE